MISDNVDSLTKPKKTKAPSIQIQEPIPAPIITEVPQIPQIAPVVVEKVKKPRTQKQKDSFAQTASIRQANIIKRRQEQQLEKAKAIIAKNQPSTLPVISPENVPVQPTIKADEKEIIKKEKQKPTKKKKQYTIIVDDSDSDSDSDSDVSTPIKPVKQEPPKQVEQTRMQQPKPKEREFSSQQNRKSKITIGDSKPIDYNSFFCD